MRLSVSFAGVLLCFVVVCGSVHYAESALLYGLVNESSVQLVSIDLGTFKTTNIGKPSGVAVPYTNLFSGAIAIDAAARIYYFTTSDGDSDTSGSHIVGLSLNNGSVVRNVSLDGARFNMIAYLDVDTTTGDLLVTGSGYDIGTNVFYRLNTLTQKVTLVLQPPPSEAWYTSAFDSTHRKWYTLMADNTIPGGTSLLYEIDTVVGTLQQETNFSSFVGLRYDPTTDLMYTLAWPIEGDACPNCNGLVSYNATSNIFKTISVLSSTLYDFRLAGVAPLDIQGRRITFKATDNHLHTLDFTKGTIISISINPCLIGKTCPFAIGYA